MSPVSSGDVYALGLGFFADRVLRAIRETSAQRATDETREVLGEASSLLEELAASVGTPSPGGATMLSFGALHSFRYAAEALSAMPGPAVTKGLRSRFASLADTMKRLCQGETVKPENLDAVTGFFRALAEATFQNWSAILPTPKLEPEPSRWMRFSAAS